MPSSTSYYAVRGGNRQGVYRDWASAQDANFQEKMSARNAGRFSNEGDAMAYILLPANPEGWQKTARETAYLVLAYLALLFAGLGASFIVWVIANKVEDYYSCSRFVNLLHPACVATNKVMLSLRMEALTFVVTATTYVCSSIIGGYALLNGLIPKIAQSFGK